MSAEKSITHIRPRFKFVVTLPCDQVLARMVEQKELAADRVIGSMIDGLMILDIPEAERHYWSPQLTFRAEPDEDNPEHTVIRGLIGPRPAVWTMFVFIYFSLGILGFFVGSYGLTQWMMGKFSYLVLALPGAFFFMLTAYAAGKYGESLGKDQVEVLKQFVRDSLRLRETQRAE